MKCRNWRTEDPERPENPEEPEEPESPESPESPEASGKGPSGPLRKIRNLRKIPSASSPARKYMLFAPKPQALRRFICPATAHLRTKCRTPLRCRPQNTPAPRRNPFPCVSLRNRPKAAPEHPENPENPEHPEKPETPEHPEPSGTLRPPLRTHHTDYLQSHILQFKTQHTYFNYK